MKPRYRIVVALLGVTFLYSSVFADTPSRGWLAKTARILRYGKTLGPSDPVLELQKLTHEQAIDHFMNDSNFMDTVFDFNLFFFNLRPDTLFTIDSEGVRKYPFRMIYEGAALQSALETYHNGDYLKVLSWTPPVYFPPMTPPNKIDSFFFYPEEKENPISPDLPPIEYREKVYQMLKARTDRFIAWWKTDGQKATKTEVCNYFDEEISLNSPQLPFFRLGFDGRLLIDSFFLLDDFSVHECRTKEPLKTNPETVAIQQMQLIRKLLDLAKTMDDDTFKIRSLADFKSVSATDLKYPYFYLSRYGFDYFENTAPNTSTNMNRKRAKRILSQYFCDDLTPISLVKADTHTDNRHASEAACVACHYKLDPMAGFFRNLGGLGRDYSGSEEIVFDGGGRMSLSTYVQNWKSEDPEREWNIGYIRSATQTKFNDYGVDLRDLEQIIRTAPEVKACIVRRMSEYFIGKEVLVSEGFLADVTEEFIENSKVNSSRAFKTALKRMLMTRAFSEPDPDPNTCYDYGPGEDPANQPPCRVAYTLKNNCISCHNSKNSSGRLDLSRWVADNDGALNFWHTNKNGERIPRNQTMASILERLTTDDSERQMPLNKFMHPKDREKLYLWAQKEMSKP